ncbi:hypothetical protein AB0H34_37500 [Saccharopolyspora shandongensis]|uniref:effector-associated constant component EACC1 n=1 Tax=Saccharopolyspora shandongensis TaxID=418495 RepID=UPI003411D207
MIVYSAVLQRAKGSVGPMRIRVLSDRDSQEELFSLRDWLSREDELRGRVSVDQPPVPPGQMGAAIDILTVAVGTGGAVTVLARSVSVWLRHRSSDVKIEITGEDGRRVTVAADRVPDATALVEQVLRGSGDEATQDS